METNDQAACKCREMELGDEPPGWGLYADERRLMRKIRRLFLLCCIAGLSSLLGLLSGCPLKGV